MDLHFSELLAEYKKGGEGTLESFEHVVASNLDDYAALVRQGTIGTKNSDVSFMTIKAQGTDERFFPRIIEATASTGRGR